MSQSPSSKQLYGRPKRTAGLLGTALELPLLADGLKAGADYRVDAGAFELGFDFSLDSCEIVVSQRISRSRPTTPGLASQQAAREMHPASEEMACSEVESGDAKNYPALMDEEASCAMYVSMVRVHAPGDEPSAMRAGLETRGGDRRKALESLLVAVGRASRDVEICARARKVSAAVGRRRESGNAPDGGASDGGSLYLAGGDPKMRALLELAGPGDWPEGAREAAHRLGLFGKYEGRISRATSRGCTADEASRAQRLGVAHELIVRYGVFRAGGQVIARVAEAENYGGSHAAEHGVGGFRAVHDDARGALGAGHVFLYAYYALAAGLVMSVGRPTDRLGSPTSLLLRGVTIGDDA